MNCYKLAHNVHFIGAFDENIRTFDIIMKTANGSSYNAYLVRGSEGVAILDTVKKEFAEEFFANLESLCSYDEIKYLILHHLEPDHSGCVEELMARAPNAKLIISQRAAMVKDGLLPKNLAVEYAIDGKSISLGDKTLTFYLTPYLHWPDTMSSYLVEEKILFSGDALGSHYYDERLFNDQVGDFEYAFKYYYDHIMRPFKQWVLGALDKYAKLDIALIAPLHGPILRENPHEYIEKYRHWSKSTKHHTQKVVTIFYLSSYSNTRMMAKKIYEGLDLVENIRPSIYDLASLEESNMITLLEESDGILIGTPTINGDAPKPAWELLSLLSFVEKTGKFAGVFGSYGWTGEASEMLNERLKLQKLRLPLKPLKLKLIPTPEGLEACEAYGREFGEYLMGKEMLIELTL
jgi:NADH oxidase (H2O-forming)